ncbi:AMP-binding protein [Nocardia sp. NBC_00511]|uniref:AMP-binding protein n=1 Tax=Nocardia sp. NBC_00511 TaxID=2903591 RepID=UPI0030DE61CD
MHEVDTLTEMLTQRARSRPDTRLLIFLDRQTGSPTLAELDAAARLVASALRDRAPRGSRALLVYPTGPEFVAAFFGCLYAGVIPVPAPPPVPGVMAQRFAAIVADCAPELVLTVGEWRPLLEGSGLASVTTDELGEDDYPSIPAPYVPMEIRSSDVAYLQYTSGTTGSPRGVMHTHASILANLRLSSADHSITPDDRLVGWLPLFHDLGLVSQVLQPLFDGCEALLTQPQNFVADPAGWLRVVSERAATMIALPEFGYRMLLRRIPAEQRGDMRLEQLRLARIAAEALDPATMRAFVEGFADAGLPVEVLNTGYGLAEAVVHVCITPPGASPVVLHADRKGLARGVLREGGENAVAVVSSGRPGPGVPVMIAGLGTATPVEDGRIGQILLSGPSVARRYWITPESRSDMNGRRWRPTGSLGFVLDGVRWLPTGDLGCLINGELFVLGRIADLLVLEGHWHLPADVERTAAAAHPAIRSHACAVFSLAGNAVLMAEIAGDADEDEVADAVRRAVAAVHDIALIDIQFVAHGAVPVTTSGKLRRGACRELYRAAFSAKAV